MALGSCTEPTDRGKIPFLLGELGTAYQAVSSAPVVEESVGVRSLLLAHRFHNSQDWLQSVYAFFGLGITASATYIINDIADLHADRSHPTKRNRPIAAGTISIALASGLAPLGLAFGFAVTALAGLSATITLGIYTALTLAYAFKLKRIPLFDVSILGLLFTLRILLGCAAAHIPPSPWMLAFSAMLFFSLAMAKRHTEIAKKMADLERLQSV